MTVFDPITGNINGGGVSSNNFSMAHLGGVSSASAARTSFTLNTSKFSLIWTHRRIETGVAAYILQTDTGSRCLVGYEPGNALRCTLEQSGGVTSVEQVTTATYTDTASWHTALWHFDQANATAGDRCKTFLDGVEITSFSTDTTTGGAFASDFTNYVISTSASVLTYQFAIVTGDLVAASSTYNTTAGLPKDVRGLSNLSMLVMMQKDGTLRDLAAGLNWTQTKELVRTTDVPQVA